MRLPVRILICLGICGWLLATTLAWQRAVEGYEKKFTPALNLPGAEKPFFFDNDCYDWLVYAQRMASTGEWRIRHTDIDNVPFGRDMHWSQSIAWLEVIAGNLRAHATGESVLTAIPRAAIWINPAILALGLCLLFCALEARLGFLPAGLAVFWMLALSDVAWSFQPYRPDHQSLHLFFALATFVCLLCGGAGWTSDAARPRGFRWLDAPEPPDERSARRWFFASGIAGGLSLWIGATVQVLCLGLLGLGAVSAVFLFRNDAGNGRRFVPGLFRLWGRVGAATSLLMYAVEYLPGHLSLRLEVNHPLYALSWVAAAELMAELFQIRLERRAPTPREWGAGLLLAGVAAILPAVFLIGGVHVHALRDPEMLRMHEFINEFGSYFRIAPFGTFFGNFLILPLCAPLALWLVFSGRLTAPDRWSLWLGGVMSLGLLALMFAAQRWAPFYAEFSVVALAFALAAAQRLLVGPRRVGAVAAALVVLGGCAAFLFAERQKNLAQLLAGDALDMQIAQPILVKRFAVQMAKHVPPGQARIIAEASLGPPLSYFGGLPTTTTLYWENRDGLHAAAEFFDASIDADARRIATERGLTHVLIPLNGNTPLVFHQIRTGRPLPANSPGLASRLMRGRDVPAWLVRDQAMDGAEACVFGSYKLTYPVGVWRIEPVARP